MGAPKKWTGPCLECDEPAVCRGLCEMHYRRLHRHGDLSKPGPTHCGVCGRALNRRAYRGSKPKYHPECRREAQYIRNRVCLLAKHGLTMEDYAKLLAVQGGCCALCRRPEHVVKGSRTQLLSVDHDHACCPGAYSCGKCVRGLLCNDCNVQLRSVDDAAWLEKALGYVRR